MAQWLEALAILAEDPRLVPNIYMVAPVPGTPMRFFISMGTACTTYMQAKHSLGKCVILKSVMIFILCV